MPVTRLDRNARILLASVAVLSAGLWAAGIATVGCLDEYALMLVAAAMTVTLSGVAWGIALAARDRDKEALVRAMADFTMQRGQAVTGPQPRLQAVQA